MSEELTTSELVNQLTQEYNRENGYLTCEFKTPLLKTEALAALADSNVMLEASGLEGRWVVFHCSTCEKHSNGEAPIHVAIEIEEEES